MIISKLTSKAQTTIPQPVRTALPLKEGDAIGIADSAEGPFVPFSEWAGDADRRAYAEL